MYGAVAAKEAKLVPLLEITFKGRRPGGKNDEVAAILRGLQLDKTFFHSRLWPDALKDADDSSKTPNSPSARRPSTASIARKKLAETKSLDTDIYLNESLMPVLAQALDTLCRQLTRMQQRGELMESKVRARFNPLTWLAQQLLRLHPRAARTPRRIQLYAKFRDWSDKERGRRELLRCKGLIKQVFDGFLLRGTVQSRTIMQVIEAIDETLRLRGLLKGNLQIKALFKSVETTELGSPTSDGGRSARNNRSSKINFEDVGFTFDEFWNKFSTLVMVSDVIPFSALNEGAELRKKEALAIEDKMKAQEELLKAQKNKLEMWQANAEIYENSLYRLLKDNEHLSMIINEGKILTGLYMRPGDQGREEQVPPNGKHVHLLERLLILLGFQNIASSVDNVASGQSREPSKQPATELELAMQVSDDFFSRQVSEFPAFRRQVSEFPAFGRQVSEAPGRTGSKTKGMKFRTGLKSSKHAASMTRKHHWWKIEHQDAWCILQGLFRKDNIDGYVDADILTKVIVPPSDFIDLRKQVEEEIQSIEDGTTKLTKAVKEEKQNSKPSYQELANQLHLTMSRIQWLKDMFQTFLPPNTIVMPDSTEVEEPQVDNYPDDPSFIKKADFKELFMEIVTADGTLVSDAEFEAVYRRIDEDNSGQVEFDEFARWIHFQDVKVMGNGDQKMTFDELAFQYELPLSTIKYLFTCFQDQLPDGVKDSYPKNPVAQLAKADARHLLSMLTNMTAQEFDTSFSYLGGHKIAEGTVSFDEFLELMDVEHLPPELK